MLGHLLLLLLPYPTHSPKLKVHIVPHTHDDVGWIKTVDQYYAGVKNHLTPSSVRDIIDSVVDQLLLNSSRRFVYAEIAFFWRWWNQQNNERRDQVRSLVYEGRLQFVNGGWTMNDEATTHYSSIIDQHFIGNKALYEMFGEKLPKVNVGWQLDTFGHSYTNADLFVNMGFTSLVFSRLDLQLKKQMIKSSDLDFVWNLPSGSSIFTSLTYLDLYTAPDGFCFDVLCNDDQIQPDPRLLDYNLDEKAKTFYNHITNIARSYKEHSVMILMGGDFAYQQSLRWFRNIEILMEKINRDHDDVELFYSTPSDYAKGKKTNSSIYTHFSGDFMPYQMGKGEFWTGFFTSRPSLKFFVRESNGVYQSYMQLFALAGRGGNILDDFDDAMGMTSHHDAVTGTEKKAVAEDYALRLDSARKRLMGVVGEIVADKLGLPGGLELHFCQLNESKCLISESGYGEFTVIVFNPLLRTVVYREKVPVKSDYEVFSRNRFTSQQVFELRGDYVYLEAELLPLSLNTFRFSKIPHMKRQQKRGTQEYKLENNLYSVILDSFGRISAVFLKASNKTIKVEQSFGYYKGGVHPIASGAYIFQPDGEQISLKGEPVIEIIRNEMFEKSITYFKNLEWVSFSVTLFKTSEDIEVEWTVGPIDVGDAYGKEIVVNYETDLNSGDKFFTDSNGRFLVERIRNKRGGWDFNQTNNVSGNFFPITSLGLIRDDHHQMSLLVDRSVGFSSLKDGAATILLHRRLLFDDHLGVAESLNDTSVVTGRHWLVVSPVESSFDFVRPRAQEIFRRPLTLFTRHSHFGFWSPVRTELFKNINLLTLRPLDTFLWLVRFENIFGDSEGKYSIETCFGLKIFDNVKRIEEFDLLGFEKISETSNWTICLRPMQIRTFRFYLNGS